MLRFKSRWCSWLGGIALLAMTAAPARAFTITASDGMGWANWGANLAAANADRQFVINEFQALFTNPITIKIEFGYGFYSNHAFDNTKFAGAAAWFPQLENANPQQYSLADTETLFKNHAMNHPENIPINIGAANLPAAYPNPGGSTMFFVGDAEYKALTGGAQNGDTIDGYVGFTTNVAWTFGPGGNFRSALEHEISHVMGRFDSAYQNPANGGNPPYLTPLDFYKYAPGTQNLDPNRDISAFSIDGGNTQNAFRFNQSSDTSDWDNQGTDSFNAGLAAGQTMSTTDLIEMQALGWDPAAPEPSTLVLLSAGLAGLLAYGRRRGRRCESGFQEATVC